MPRHSDAPRTVSGAYELMGVNGSLLPAPVEETGAGGGLDLRCRITAGELRLEGDGSFRHALTARYDAPAGATYTRVLEHAGTWRFVCSALDEWSGDVTLVSENGHRVTAAVTRLSLVRRDPGGLTWVYLRRDEQR
jgi:hypothetical protein